MIGAAATQALVSRALFLAKAEIRRLAGAKLNKKGRIEGLAGIDPPHSRREGEEVELQLMENIVELLCTSVGEAMTLRLIQEEWPYASFVDAQPGKKGTHEQSDQSQNQ